MAIPIYLAMTQAEIANCRTLPEKIAWMSCLLSPFGTGIVGIPQMLPPGSILILSDRIPIHNHDPELIADQLQSAIDDLKCDSLLLDLQQPGVPQTQALVRRLSQLTCTVCISECYSDSYHGPILLPPIPVNQNPEIYLRKYDGREIWLESDLSSLQITVSTEGIQCHPNPDHPDSHYPFVCEELFCHYRHEVDENAHFYLKRTKDDLSALLSYSKQFNVTRAIGFYHELKVDNILTQ